jgi:hypothetical protein
VKFTKYITVQIVRTSFRNIMLDTAHCLRYIWYIRRFGSWLCFRLQVTVMISNIPQTTDNVQHKVPIMNKKCHKALENRYISGMDLELKVHSGHMRNPWSNWWRESSGFSMKYASDNAQCPTYDPITNEPLLETFRESRTSLVTSRLTAYPTYNVWS